MNATNCESLRDYTRYNRTNTTICDDIETGQAKSNGFITGGMFITCMWIILSNILVVFCFIAGKEIKKNLLNLHILSLSFTDILVGFSALIMTLNYQKPILFSSYGPCLMLFIFYIVAQVASVYHTFGICLHRFITVHCRLKSPQFYQGITKRNTMIQVGLVWVMSAIFAMIPFFAFGKWTSSVHICSIENLLHDKYFISLKIWHTILLTPQVIINLMYISMYIKVRHSLSSVMTFPHNDTNHLTHLTKTTTEVSNSRNPKYENASAKVSNRTKIETFNVLHTNRENHSLSLNKSSSVDQIPPLNKKRILLEKRINAHGFMKKQVHKNANDMPSCSKQENVESYANHQFLQNTGVISVSSHRKNGVETLSGTSETQKGRRHETNLRNDKHSNVLVTIGVILVAFNVCLTPLNVLFTLQSIQKDALSRTIRIIIITFSLFNSGVNPIIYAFCIKQFRDSVVSGWIYIKRLLF